MANITSGEERFINESINYWKASVNALADMIPELPAQVEDRIKSLGDSYVEEFRNYYLAEAEKGEIQLSGQVLKAFDDEWDKNHPEFYDMNKLFEGCDSEMLEKCSDELDRLQKIFN